MVDWQFFTISAAGELQLLPMAGSKQMNSARQWSVSLARAAHARGGGDSADLGWGVMQGMSSGHLVPDSPAAQLPDFLGGEGPYFICSEKMQEPDSLLQPFLSVIETSSMALA